jgi:16S rRNA (cytidine1402-2'-O)-methyltransferase
VVSTVSDLLEIFGDRKVCLCRELTKVFEEVRLMDLSRLTMELEKTTPKGEICLVIDGMDENIPNINELEANIDVLVGDMVREGKSIKDIVQAVSVQTGMPKNLVYKKALEIKNSSKP